MLTDAIPVRLRLPGLVVLGVQEWGDHIEKLRRWVKQRVTHAHPWCDDLLPFKEQVLAEFQRLSAGSMDLKRYCGLDRLFC